MVKTFKVYLGDKSSTNPVYSCAHCRAHLAKHENLISKSFQGSQGRAYLFDSVVNVASGKPEERVLLTGLHSVADIKCECCRTTLGWKYEQAFEPSQKYKEGKYIIEVAHLIKDTNWDDVQPKQNNQSNSFMNSGSPSFSASPPSKLKSSELLTGGCSPPAQSSILLQTTTDNCVQSSLSPALPTNEANYLTPLLTSTSDCSFASPSHHYSHQYTSEDIPTTSNTTSRSNMPL